MEASGKGKPRKFTKKAIVKDWKRNRILYLMLLPMVVFFIVFAYLPMGGLLMAFENYKPKTGIFGSVWVGFQNFKDFFGSVFAWWVIQNTLIISLLQLVISFPATIIFALLLNELKETVFKKGIQLITYMPHFISMVVLAALAVLCLLPMLHVAFASFSDAAWVMNHSGLILWPHGFTLESYKLVFGTKQLLNSYGNTFFMCSVQPGWGCW